MKPENSMTPDSMPAAAGPLLTYTLERIRGQYPRYAHKLDKRMSAMDGLFFDRAEWFLGKLSRFLEARGRHLDYGIDCHVRLHESMIQERMDFLRTGRYANSTFADVERCVYANPAIMEQHMYGLVFSQFFWPEQYTRLVFFCDGLERYRDQVRSYLEIGGGHALYISSATEILAPETHFEMVDISATSMDLARAMSPNERITYHLCDIFQFPAGRQYDMIVAGEVLEHLEDPRQLLAQMRRMLKPGGRVFISTPVNAPTLDHIYLFNNVQEIRDLLRSAGFTIESEVAQYAEDMPDERAEKLKIARMFAAFLRVEE